MAADLPAVLGLPDGLQSVLWACGLWCRSGHHDDRGPCVFPGNLQGEQAALLYFSHQ